MTFSVGQSIRVKPKHGNLYPNHAGRLGTVVGQKGVIVKVQWSGPRIGDGRPAVIHADFLEAYAEEDNQIS